METPTEKPKLNLFGEPGDYLFNIELRRTADPHSREVYVDKIHYGTFLFHDWSQPCLDPTQNTNNWATLRMRVWPQLMRAINEDTSIAYQKSVDQQPRS